MWYVSGTGWEPKPGTKEPKHYYRIKYAESKDGIHWETKNRVCIDYRHDEYAIARPVVYREGGGYRMWYSFRGGDRAYGIGYGESQEGIHWIRKDDEAGIDVSKEGWDSSMVCYPYVFKHRNQTYMLYNGNGYGKTGFGLAVLDNL
jgi:hypothetical protein